jgi:hypothetical protein
VNNDFRQKILVFLAILAALQLFIANSALNAL